jgi:4-hydroxy-tetrahydrodipicolinate synthase
MADGCIDIYSGNDDQILPLLSLGGLGVISVTANIIPEDTSRLVHSFMEGNIEESRRLQLKAMDLCHALFCEVNPIPVKTAANLMGFNVGPLRGPLFGMSEAGTEKLRKALTDFGIKVQ